MRFSERYGYEKPPVVIRETLTPDIKNSIITFYDNLQVSLELQYGAFYDLSMHLWTDFFDKRKRDFKNGEEIIINFIESNEVAWYKKNQEIKEEIQLFDEEDEIKLPPIPWLNGLSELVAKQSLIIDKLLNLLISKDIIDVDDVKDIQLNITDENVWNKRREFNRISRRDLDEYKFKD